MTTDLKTLTRVWMGDLSIRGAVGTGKITLDGARPFRQGFEQWLGLSGFADINPAKRA